MFDLEKHRFSKLIVMAFPFTEASVRQFTVTHTVSLPIVKTDIPKERNRDTHWPMGLQMGPPGKTHQLL